MNKRQLIAASARRSGLTQYQMRQAMEAMLETIAEALAASDDVVLSDLGRFYVQTYPGRRLQRFDGTGCYTVDDRPVPAFRSSAALRRRIKERIR